MSAVELNGPQISLLEWIRDGCPEGVYDGYSHRISATALRSRGLVRISGHGPRWRAEITEAGIHYLRGKRPDTERSTSTRSSPGPAIPNTSESNPSSHDRELRAETKERGTRAKPRLAPTEQLIADLLAAGGVMRVPYWTSAGERNYRQLVEAARRWDKVPEGKRL